MDYFDRVKPTYIENWPSSLYRLSIAQVDIPLTVADAVAVGFHIMEFGEGFVPKTPAEKQQLIDSGKWATNSMLAEFCGGTNPGPRISPPVITPEPLWVQQQERLVAAVRARAGDALTKFPHGAVIRLGSRSPKDAYSWCNGGPKLVAGDDPLKHIVNCSERMYEDLTWAIQSNYAPHLFVRQWLDIEPWAEFRCFIKDGRLLGVSQYDYHRVYPEIAAHHDTIIYWLRYYMGTMLLPACGELDNLICDVIVFIKSRIQPSGLKEVVVEFKLLEINPFFEMTDPCLFDWRHDLDRTFRYLDQDKKTVAVSLV